MLWAAVGNMCHSVQVIQFVKRCGRPRRKCPLDATTWMTHLGVSLAWLQAQTANWGGWVGDGGARTATRVSTTMAIR